MSRRLSKRALVVAHERGLLMENLPDDDSAAESKIACWLTTIPSPGRAWVAINTDIRSVTDA